VLELLGRGEPGGLQLHDSYREVHPDRGKEEGTYHGFGGGRSGPRIDYILHCGFFRAAAARIENDPVDGHWASDHFAVTARLEFPAR